MTLNKFRVERTFVLGAVAQGKEYETVTFAIEWSIEHGDTLEQAEQKAVQLLYAMADRERKRRYEYLKQRAIEKREKATGKVATA